MRFGARSLNRRAKSSAWISQAFIELGIRDWVEMALIPSRQFHWACQHHAIALPVQAQMVLYPLVARRRGRPATVRQRVRAEAARDAISGMS
jgi:hypothetical protein